ncbi:MAG: alpha/beta hydrolase [Alphaproteobacteria bacterium]
MIVSLLLTACAPLVQAPGPAARPAAIAGQGATLHLAMADGAVLPLSHWGPDQPRAIILALHGLNDYARAFDRPARLWAAAGIATYAYDQRGFGASGRAGAPAAGRGLWPGADGLASDLASAVRLIAARHPGVPLYGLGESMGAAVLVYAHAGGGLPPTAGAILVAPAVWGYGDLPVVARAVLWSFAHTVPWAGGSGAGFGRLPSDNLAMLRALADDPLVRRFTRWDVAWGLTRLMDQAKGQAAALPGRSLILYGARDRIIPPDAVQRFLAGLPATGPDNHTSHAPRFAFYDTGWHMLLRDLAGDRVSHDIAAWITSSAPSLPSGADQDAVHRLSHNVQGSP